MYIIRKKANEALKDTLIFADNVDDIMSFLPDDRDEALLELETMDVIVIAYDHVNEEFVVNEANIDHSREIKFMPMRAVVEIVDKGWTLQDIDQ